MINYLTWIANLGVVPLFLFWVFLFAPLFFIFAFLRFSVTAVLEAMMFPLWLLNKRVLLITLGLIIVKDCISLSRSDTAQVRMISKGEQFTIPFSSHSKFSVGRKDLLATLVLARQGQLLVKGKKTGFSDLQVWDKNVRQQYKIYILPQNTFRKLEPILEVLKDSSLQLELKGKLMILKGEINSRAEYDWLKTLERNFKDQLYFEVKLSDQLYQEIIRDIYRQSFNQQLLISCQNQYLYFNCSTHAQERDFKQLENTLGRRFFINLESIPSQTQLKNYRLKLKILIYENLDHQSLYWGLDKIQTSYRELFEHGVKSIIQKNDILLNELNINLQVIAEPEIILTKDQKSTLKIGSDVAFEGQQLRNGNVLNSLQWRFAGLKVVTELTEIKHRMAITYNVSFTRPTPVSITGNSHQGKIFINLNQPFRLLHVDYEAMTEEQSQMPLVSKIPILGKLFISKDQQKNFKRLEIFASLEEGQE